MDITAPNVSRNDPVVRQSEGSRIPPLPPYPAARTYIKPIPLAVIVALGVVGASVAYQRIGTTAAADAVTSFQRAPNGFAAVGMTEDRPGFVCLSLVDREQVAIDTLVSSNALYGPRTHVEISTPKATWTRWLRGPQVVLIDESGAISTVGVDWSHKNFVALSQAMDCENFDHLAGKAGRCGEPMADMRDVLNTWPASHIPSQLNMYLAKTVRIGVRP